MEHISIIWPEYKHVSVKTISMWYADAVANGEVEAEHTNIPNELPMEQAKALQDIGHITLLGGQPL